MQAITSSTDAIRTIPDPETVRAQLAQRMREVDLLRRLLRLSEAAARDRRQQTEVAAR